VLSWALGLFPWITWFVDGYLMDCAIFDSYLFRLETLERRVMLGVERVTFFCAARPVLELGWLKDVAGGAQRW
jgi:hypothetical protein